MQCFTLLCNIQTILPPAVFIFLFVFILGGIEFSKHRFHLDPEITRKIAHTLSAVISIFLPYVIHTSSIVIVSIVFAFFIFFTRKTHLLSSIHRVERQTYGAELFPLGIGLAAFVLLPSHTLAFQFGMLLLAGSDSLAYIIGDIYGNHRIPLLKTTKTWEGTVTFAITTLATILLMGKSLTFGVIGGSVLLTILELVSIRGFDNLTLPVSAGLAWLLIF